MYPLLIQGIYSNPNAGQLSIAPSVAANLSWNNLIQVGRGNLIAIDPVTTGVALTNVLQDCGTFSYNIGGQTIIDNSALSNYLVENKPRTNEILSINQPGGQSVQLTAQNTASIAAGVVIHHYFENKYAIPTIIQARFNPTLKTRIKDYIYKVNSGTKNNNSAVYNVPIGLGNIIGIEFSSFANNGSLITLTHTVFSVAVGGINIVQEACAGAFCAISGRPSQIFPILIRPGETFQINVDSNNAAAGAIVGIVARLYFDDDLTGKKIY